MTLNREACERRVYRLAALLTGNPHAATRVIEAVVDAQPDVRRLDSARLDRLTVLRCREIEPSVLVADAVPSEAASALAGLPAQPREAWVLGRLYRTPLRETARAMDCSVTATTRHLEKADREMAGGDAEAWAKTLGAWSQTLDVPPFYRARRRRRQRVRRLAVAAFILAAVAAILWAAQHLGGG